MCVSHASVSNVQTIEHVYWPGITAVLKIYIPRCGICNRYQQQQWQEPLHHHKAPEIPWEKIGVDLYELDREAFLIAVDY